MKAILILFLVVFVPASTGEILDVSGDGSHLIKLAYQGNNVTIYVDDKVFSVNEFIYTVDGNGSVLVASDDQRVYFYSYDGELLKEEQASKYVYSLAVEGSKIYFATYENNTRKIMEDPFEPQSLLSLNVSYISDLEAYEGRLYFIAYKEERGYLYEYSGTLKELASVNATFLAIIDGKLVAYDYEGKEMRSMELSKGSKVFPEPKPIGEISAPEAATTATAASAGILSYLYLIRERRLSSVLSLRRLVRRRYKRDALLLLPIAGRLLEVLVMPYKGLLSFIVLTSLSVSAAYGVHTLITRNFRRRFKAISILLAIYAAISSFYASMLFTRRYAVVLFYALSIAYSTLSIKASRIFSP